MRLLGNLLFELAEDFEEEEPAHRHGDHDHQDFKPEWHISVARGIDFAIASREENREGPFLFDGTPDIRCERAGCATARRKSQAR